MARRLLFLPGSTRVARSVSGNMHPSISIFSHPLSIFPSLSRALSPRRLPLLSSLTLSLSSSPLSLSLLQRKHSDAVLPRRPIMTRAMRACVPADASRNRNKSYNYGRPRPEVGLTSNPSWPVDSARPRGFCASDYPSDIINTEDVPVPTMGRRPGRGPEP